LQSPAIPSGSGDVLSLAVVIDRHPGAGSMTIRVQGRLCQRRRNMYIDVHCYRASTGMKQSGPQDRIRGADRSRRDIWYGYGPKRMPIMQPARCFITPAGAVGFRMASCLRACDRDVSRRQSIDLGWTGLAVIGAGLCGCRYMCTECTIYTYISNKPSNTGDHLQEQEPSLLPFKL
jgi:hypothetical protein